MTDLLGNQVSHGSPRTARRSALVTGASRGIGRAITERLAAAGFNMTLSGRKVGALEDVARGLASTGAATEIVPADMAVEDDVRRLAHRHTQRFGAMDLLVLCAGVGTSGAIAEYPIHRFDRQVAVNMRAPFVLAQECLPSLRRAAACRPERGARIVAIASITGVVSEPGLAAYGATKAALISLCQSINVEESASGVSTTAISPGYVDTEMSSWVRQRINPDDMIQAGDIAQLVAALTQMSARAVVPSIVVARPGDSQWRA
jgi:NAD(P)-dependent dehydrogenase (short-subunit alcohol dehydrogenase family)